jgi:hypothetical protein
MNYYNPIHSNKWTHDLSLFFSTTSFFLSFLILQEISTSLVTQIPSAATFGVVVGVALKETVS